jgi:hypothetical protein
VNLTKIVMRPPLSRCCLGAFAAAAWLIFTVAIPGSPSNRPLTETREDVDRFCALSSAHRAGGNRQPSAAKREFRPNELKARVLFSFQSRS